MKITRLSKGKCSNEITNCRKKENRLWKSANMAAVTPCENAPSSIVRANYEKLLFWACIGKDYILIIELDYETFPARLTKNKLNIFTLWFLGISVRNVNLFNLYEKKKLSVNQFSTARCKYSDDSTYFGCSLEVYNSQFKIAFTN